MSQKRREPLDELARIFGGKVFPQRVHGIFRAWGWTLTGPDAGRVCEAVVPYLKTTKRAEAEALIDYLATGNWRGRKLTEKVIAERERAIKRHELARAVTA